MTIKRISNFTGTEEDYVKAFPDTNYNDVIRMEIKINGKTYTVKEKIINTQKEWYQFQTQLMSIIEDIQLKHISKCGE